MEPSAERFRRADAVFDAALDLPPGARAAFVEQRCAGDAELSAEVHRLLRAHERSDGFLSAPAAAVAAPLLAASPGTDAPFTTTSAAPDRIGPYRIEREIGRGGMGVVYLAERDDPTFRQRVALKVLRAGTDGTSAGNQAHVGRFLAERQLLVSLEHPHIARLFDGGVTADGLPYYTMAYCEGGSLAERLRTQGAMPLDEALRIGGELAAALGAAHARGVVHRDVKPANVLFDASGSVRLADFGIAKLLGGDLTRTGEVLGTPAYLAPEQVVGEPADHRADLWALGVTLYEMLVGRRPFDGPSYAAVLHAIVSTVPERPRAHMPGIPPAIDALVMRLLEKDAAMRPQSADEIVRVLNEMSHASYEGGSGSASAEARRAQPSAAQPQTGSRARRRAAFIAAGGTLAILAGITSYLAWERFAGSDRRTVTALPVLPASAAPSLAVLPFVNTGGDAADEPFTDGLTDELIGALGKVRGLRVIARSSVFALKGKNISARAIGDTLGVNHVLEGTVRKSGDRLRVFAQLVSARNDSVLWSEQYDREVVDLFAVQEEIARAMAGALRLQLTLGDASTRGTSDPEARDLYLRGRFALYTRTGPADLPRAARLFEAAIARDSSYARAYSGLSDTYASIGNFAYGRPGEAFAKARANARRALALDSTLAEARASLAHTLCVHDYDWTAAEREFRKAIAQDPGYPFARMTYAVCLSMRERYDEAIAQLDTARQLDPLRFGIGALLGRVYVTARRPDEAIAVLTKTLDINPQADLVWQQLGEAYLLKGRSADAIAAFRKAALLSGVRDSAQLAYALAVTGDRAAAERIVRDIVASSSTRYVPPFHVAMAYSGLGQVDEAFRWLDRGYDERASFMVGVKVTAAFAPLHGDPRWGRLLAKMGLND
jgi:serine/threonine-protein kinase